MFKQNLIILRNKCDTNKIDCFTYPFPSHHNFIFPKSHSSLKSAIQEKLRKELPSHIKSVFKTVDKIIIGSNGRTLFF